MIICKDKESSYFLNDELYIKGNNKNGVDFISSIIDSIKDKFRPENGSPTLIVAEELKRCGFDVKVELPFYEQLDSSIF